VSAELTITEQEANRIIEMDKTIEDSIKWTKKPQREGIYEFIVPVEIDDPYTKLTLIVNRNEKNQKFSFTILYNSTVRIKSLDIGKGHKNPPDRKQNVGKKHKHTWTNEWKDQWAYKPDDITDGADFRQVFKEFLIECNIKTEQELPKLPPHQEEMIFDEIELSGDQGIY
jgi:hypothetical protein